MPKMTSASAGAVDTVPAESPVEVIAGPYRRRVQAMCHDPAVKKWAPLVILAAAQFVMVLDQAVMNVSISQLVDDFDTSVTAIQAVITLYSLVMAMFMLTGGKIGDIFGRRRAFVIGLCIYGVGSGITAVAPTVGVLAFGWSMLEGLGAALVLPALAALISGNYEGKDRAVAYSVIGGVAGAGIAVGPIVGGWATTELSWRVVFARRGRAGASASSRAAACCSTRRDRARHPASTSSARCCPRPGSG